MSILGVVRLLQKRGCVKYLLCLSDFNLKLNVVTDFGKKESGQNCMKIRPLITELFYADRRTNWQTRRRTIGGQADEQTGGQADGEIGGQADGQIGGQADGKIGGQADRQIGGQADGQTGGQADGQTGGQADRKIGVRSRRTNWRTSLTKLFPASFSN